MAPAAAGSPGAGGAAAAAGGGAGGDAVAAVVENRAREVGLVVIHPGLGALSVQQFVESSASYATLGALLQLHRPGAVVTLESPHAKANGVLGANSLVASFPCEVVPRTRSDFCDTRGLEVLLQVASNPEEVESLTSGESRGWYLAFSALNALARHYDDLSFAESSLHVEVAHSLLHMFLDSSSLETLEVFECLNLAQAGARGGAGQGRGGASGSSLFDAIDYTVTAAGAMKLRASLVQPFKDVESISARHAAVEELLSEGGHVDLAAALRSLPRSVDRLCADFINIVTKGEQGAPRHVARARKHIQSILELRDILLELPRINKTLGQAQSPLLVTVKKILEGPALAHIADAIDAFVDPDAAKASDQFVKMVEHVFCLRGGVSGFLDLARKAFLELEENVSSAVDSYRCEFGIPELKLRYTKKRGFWVEIPKREQFETLQRNSQQKFVELNSTSRGYRLGRASAVHCSTAELTSLNSRMRHACANCYRLTGEALGELVEGISSKISVLRALADSLGILDLLQSFAHYAAARNCVRPTVAKGDAPLAIVDGRHPILESEVSVPFCPNSTFLSKYHTLEMVFGPNGGGKTTYLRQVAQLVLLAQAGCYVPADFMSFSCVDAIFARSLMADEGGDIKEGKSSFLIEMADVARIEKCATARSMVLVDEVGRATGTAEGMAIAWAVAEMLLAIRCKAIFATHFTPLSQLNALYPACTIRSFKVQQQDGSLKFTCALGDESAEINLNYGILIARASSLPRPLVDTAAAMAEAYAACPQTVRGLFCTARLDARVAFKTAAKLSYLAALYDGGHISLDLVLAEIDELRGRAAASAFSREAAPPQTGAT